MKNTPDLVVADCSEVGANLRGSETAISWRGKGSGERQHPTLRGLEERWHPTPRGLGKETPHTQVGDAEVRLASQTLQPFIFCAKMTEVTNKKRRQQISQNTDLNNSIKSLK